MEAHELVLASHTNEHPESGHRLQGLNCLDGDTTVYHESM